MKQIILLVVFMLSCSFVNAQLPKQYNCLVSEGASGGESKTSKIVLDRTHKFPLADEKLELHLSIYVGYVQALILHRGTTEQVAGATVPENGFTGLNFFFNNGIARVNVKCRN